MSAVYLSHMKCSKYVLMVAVVVVAVLVGNYTYQSYTAKSHFAASVDLRTEACPDAYIVNKMPMVMEDVSVFSHIERFVGAMVTNVHGTTLRALQDDYTHTSANGVYNKGGYFILGESRKDLSEMDLDWVSTNCPNLAETFVY